MRPCVPRGRRVEVILTMAVSEAIENYLETIYILSQQQNEVHAIDVCSYLSYSRPTVSIVLRQMRENGLITAQQYNAALDRSTASVLEKSPASTDMYAYPHYVEYAISDVVDTFLDLNGLEDTSANRYEIALILRTGG